MSCDDYFAVQPPSFFDQLPLSPKSDQLQISPCNINALYNRMVMRITDIITQDEFA